MCKICRCRYLKGEQPGLLLCVGQIEASTPSPPPGQPPGHLTFLKIIVKIPPYPGQNAVQWPTLGSVT